MTLTKILASTSHMLRLSLQDEAPSPFDENENYTKLFQRVFEIQAEQCDAIYLLYNKGLYRPGYAVLRSVLETMSTLIWLSLNTERYIPLFEAGKQPNMKEILRRIGWEEEYDRTFKYLSGFVHIDMENAEFYREYKLGSDASEPFPEILPDAEYYILEGSKDPQLLTINLMSHEEAKQKYSPYLVAKTFDFIAAGFQKLYGSEYSRKKWWQEEAGLLCMKLVTKNSELTNKMLWSIQPKQKRSKI